MGRRSDFQKTTLAIRGNKLTTPAPQDADKFRRAIIGCIALNSQDALAACLTAGLTPEHLGAGLNGAIYSAALDRYAASKPVDILILADIAAHTGHALPSPLYIDDCCDTAVSSQNVEHYIERVMLDALCSDLKAAATEAAALSTTATPDTAAETLDAIRSRFAALGQVAASTESLADVARRLISDWRKPLDQRNGIRWPLAELNEHIGALTSEYVVLAAHESVGKTAFACNMAVVNAFAGARVAIKYIEAKRDQVVPRLISALGEVNTLRLKQGRGSPDDFDRAESAATKLETLALEVDDAISTTDQILAWGQNAKARGARFLIIDNMKHIQYRQKFSNLPELFRAISLGVKRVRDATGLPVMLLHHLSADDQMSWSRDVRRDADILLTMKLDESRTVLPSRANHFVGNWWVLFEAEKVRDGKAGFAIQARFDKELQTFREPLDVMRQDLGDQHEDDTED